MQTDLPVFRQHDSGLYVPAPLSRRRQVWTRTEWKLYERAVGLLASRGLAMQLRCDAPRCEEPKITHIPGDEPILQCGCTDRVFTAAF